MAYKHSMLVNINLLYPWNDWR